jgi:hypothetical protein
VQIKANICRIRKNGSGIKPDPFFLLLNLNGRENAKIINFTFLVVTLQKEKCSDV